MALQAVGSVGFSSGIQMPSQPKINGKKIAIGMATAAMVIAIGVLVILIARNAAKKNNVQEKCTKGFYKKECRDAVLKTALQTGVKAAPIIGSCAQPLGVNCISAVGTGLLTELTWGFDRR